VHLGVKVPKKFTPSSKQSRVRKALGTESSREQKFHIGIDLGVKRL